MKHLPVVRETSDDALCPFCGLPIERPKDMENGVRRDMAVGRCENCGAVYVFDATGHNLGAAFVDALVFACDMDWDLAWDLLPDEDYVQEIVEGYDPMTHRIYPDKVQDNRTVGGALLFVRLIQQDLQELKSDGVAQRLAKMDVRDEVVGHAEETTAALQQSSDEPAPKLSKRDVKRCIDEYELDLIIAAARGDKKIVRYLQRLLYDNDDIIRMRAAEALGKTIKAVAPSDPTTAVNVIHGLLMPFETSSASCWGSIDAIGEIIGAAPDLFIRYTPRILPFLDDDALRPAVLRALIRIAQARPDFLKRLPTRVLPFLKSPDAETRGLTVCLLGSLPLFDAVRLADLREDEAEVRIYEGGSFVTRTVGELTAAAITP